MPKIKTILKYIMAFGFVLAGAYHFVNVNFYLKMMPPYLPAHLFLIYLSGFFEIALGVLLLIPKFSRLAAWGLVGLLFAVFPANIFMAQHAELFPEFSQTALYLRLPAQIVFIAWAFWLTRGRNLD